MELWKRANRNTSAGSASGVSGRRARAAAATRCQWLSPCMEECLPVDLSRTASTSLAASGIAMRALEPTLATRGSVVGLSRPEQRPVPQLRLYGHSRSLLPFVFLPAALLSRDVPTPSIAEPSENRL